MLALTDHDTTAGWAQATAALPRGLTLIPGAELSCRYQRPGERGVGLHLLAYLFDPEHDGLHAERERLRDSRLTRARAIVANLEADGVAITWTQVSDLAQGGAVGRPHIARALVAAGVVVDIDEAFGGYLSPRSPYYVRKHDTDVFTALALVRAAGGIPIFAHGLARRRGRVLDDDAIAEMQRAGLLGLEVDHPDHDPADRRHLHGLARELGLIRTGSSDYHGDSKPTPMAACVTDPGQLEAMLALPTALRPITG